MAAIIDKLKAVIADYKEAGEPFEGVFQVSFEDYNPETNECSFVWVTFKAGYSDELIMWTDDEERARKIYDLDESELDHLIANYCLAI